MTDTQTAVTDAGQGVAQPTPDAQHEPTLRDLVKEFDDAPKAPEQPKPAAGVAPQSAGAGQLDPKEDDELRAYVRQKREEEQRAETDKGVKDAISTLKDTEEAFAGLSDKVIEGLMYAEASRNPDFARAFAIRGQSPSAWKTALKELAQSTAAELTSQPDQKLTANREAARASVRGTSQTKLAPEDEKKAFEEKVNKMSPAELDAFIRTNG